PEPVAAGFWDPDPHDGQPATRTWRCPLLIGEPGTPASRALPHADGYLRAPDQHTATRLARQRTARLIPARWQGHLQITPASPRGRRRMAPPTPAHPARPRCGGPRPGHHTDPTAGRRPPADSSR